MRDFRGPRRPQVKTRRTSSSQPLSSDTTQDWRLSRHPSGYDAGPSSALLCNLKKARHYLRNALSGQCLGVALKSCINVRQYAMRLLLTVLLTGWVTQVWGEVPAWQALTKEQQRILAPLAERWDGLPEARRQRLLTGLERWQGMSQAQRDRLRERFSQWRKLKPEERQFIRKRFIEFLSLSPKERQRIVKRYRHYQQLSPEKRQALRERWRQMTPRQRNQWLNRHRR